MRTTVDIDPDILAAAKSLAAAERRSVGSVLSDLARKGLHASVPIESSSGSFPVFDFGRAGRPITSEKVRAALDDSL